MKSVKLDSNAIAAWAGLPASQTYLDWDDADPFEESGSDPENYATISRIGESVTIKIDIESFGASVPFAKIRKAIEDACADATKFLKAAREWSKLQFEALDSEFLKLVPDTEGSIFHFTEWDYPTEGAPQKTEYEVRFDKKQSIVGASSLLDDLRCSARMKKGDGDWVSLPVDTTVKAYGVSKEAASAILIGCLARMKKEEENEE